MRKLVLLLLCLGMVACGAAYYQSTLALPRASAPEGQGIALSISGGQGPVTLFPAVAQPYMVQVTNQGDTPCYVRTYIAFENSGKLFDDFITVTWANGTVQPLADELVAPSGERYRVCLITLEAPLAAHATATLMTELCIRSTADMADVRPAGDGYAILTAAEAVWLPEEGDPEHSTVLTEQLALLGSPTIAHAAELFFPTTPP